MDDNFQHCWDCMRLLKGNISHDPPNGIGPGVAEAKIDNILSWLLTIYVQTMYNMCTIITNGLR